MKVVLVGGGSMVTKLTKKFSTEVIDTRFGPQKVHRAIIKDLNVYSIHRHDDHHTVPAHAVNYKRIIETARLLEADLVVGISICGAISRNFSVGDIIAYDQIFDFTKSRSQSFYDDKSEVRHANMANPVCPSAFAFFEKVFSQQSVIGDKPSIIWGGIMVGIDGPRMSTKAEVKFFDMLDAATINMSCVPEAFLAREAGLCYLGVSLVSDAEYENDGHNDMVLIAHNVSRNEPEMLEVIDLVLEKAPSFKNYQNCSCKSAFDKALFKIDNPVNEN